VRYESEQERLEVLRGLLELGVKTNHVSQQGETALQMHAKREGWADVILMLDYCSRMCAFSNGILAHSSNCLFSFCV